jgi:hypothetical protein
VTTKGETKAKGSKRQKEMGRTEEKIRVKYQRKRIGMTALNYGYIYAICCINLNVKHGY